jgi:MATE family multidrug resistance protein
LAYIPPTAERRRTILAAALPIIGGMASQNLLNLVDTWMVGALGPAALAGVGLASFLNFVAVAAIAGLSPAVQALAARRFGGGHFGDTATALNGGLLLSAAIGIPLSILLIIFTPSIMALLNSDPAVVQEGGDYLAWRLIAVAAVGMNFAFRGYWSAVNMARMYLYVIIGIHALNVPISYVLIFGHLGAPELGVRGAAIGTSVSVIVGTLVYFALALRYCRSQGFLVRTPSGTDLGRLLRLGIPNAVQQFLFASGLTAMFWIIGLIGTAELAVANVLVNIMLNAILPGVGFGIAAASLAGQSMGRGDLADAARWPWDVYRVSLPIFGSIAAIALLLTDPLLTLFLRDPELVALGHLPLQLFGLGVLIDAIGLILMHALLGAGAARLVMVVGVGMQWLLFLPLAYLLGPVMGLGLIAVWSAMLIYRGLQAVIFIAAWRDGAWKRIRL